MRRLMVVAAAAAMAVTGCATMKNDKTVCAEYRGLLCASAPECSMDYARGCQVCQCSPAARGQEGGLPTGVPPDKR